MQEERQETEFMGLKGRKPLEIHIEERKGRKEENKNNVKWQIMSKSHFDKHKDELSLMPFSIYLYLYAFQLLLFFLGVHLCV